MIGKKIMVVDDEPALGSILCTVLKHLGYQPTHASGAQNALDLLEDSPEYDLVISDVMMRGGNGLNLLDILTIEYPSIPVVIVSASHDIHTATNAFRRGAVDYLLKPFERRQLQDCVARAIEDGYIRRQKTVYLQQLEETVTFGSSRLRSTMQDLERSYDITLEAMGDALDLRDAETQGHSKRVTVYATALAQAMGLAPEDLRALARGAFLHDIGKIATPDRILLKPGELDEQETAIMREHCTKGYELVSKIPFLKAPSEIIYSHQEHFDGSGYPRGLQGNEIPLGARIFAIADTLDAITSDRPYRKGASLQVAIDEIARCSNQQFDPSIVEVFMGLPPSVWANLREEVALMSADPLSQRPARLYAA
jgi:putative nucleotidyltransferase with HDIG domain